MNEIVYLEPSEEITSVIDRIRKSLSSGLSLVVPRGSSIAQSIVNLKLLKKTADELEKEISLVANDRITRNLASQIGITVYSKVSEAERARPAVSKKNISDEKKEEAPASDGDFKVNSYYHKKEEDEDELLEPEEIKSEESAPEKSEPEEIADDNYQNENDEDREDDEPEVEKSPFRSREIAPERKNYTSNFGKPVPRKNVDGSKKLLMIVGAVVLVILIASAALFLPYAQASIQLKTTDMTVKKDIAVSQDQSQVDAAKLIVPGKIVEVDKTETKTFNATGTKDEGTKATGNLTFQNGTLVSKTLKAGTTVVSDSKISFTLDSDVSLPAGTVTTGSQGQLTGVNPGTQTGSVTAANSGNSSNLPAATTYSISGVSYVTATGATSGGTTKNVTIVSADDLTKAEASLKTDLDSSGKTDVANKAKDSKLTIVDGTQKSEMVSSSSDKNANDEAATFSYTVAMKEYGLGFADKDVQAVMASASQKSLAADKMLVNPDKTDVTYTVKNSDIDSGVVTLDAKVVNKVGEKLVASDIVNKIKNKSATSAINILEQDPNIADINFTFFPKFVNRLPIVKNRIKVSFDYAS